MNSLATYCVFDSAATRFVPTLGERVCIDPLDKPVKQSLELWLAVMGRVHASTNCKRTCAEIAAQMEKTGLPGFGAENIKRTFLRFRAAGWNWRELVAAWHLPIDDQPRGKLPPKFLNWWRRFAGQYSGGTRAAHTELTRLWKTGETIEGLGSWMSWWQERNPGRPLPAIAPELPPGCSYDNLQDKVPRGAEITVVREGYFAAQSELGILHRDRSLLRALELVAFDDKQLDFRVAVPGAGQVCKLLGLFGMDIACGYIAEHAAGARTANEEGVQRALTRSDGRGLLFQFLRRYGVPKAYPMHLLFENASFAIDQHDEDFLRGLSPNIVVKRTAMRRGSLLAGGPVETFGNPEAKGWLESYFNLLDRAVSAVPGQAGRNALTNKRGDIDSLEKDTVALLKLVQNLPAPIQAMVSLPMLTVDQGKIFLGEMVARLNWRNEHRLQGFELVPKWRIRGLGDNNPWRPVAELPLDLPDSAIEIEHFMESPAERFARLYNPADFTPIAESSLLPLLDDKRTVTVTRPFQIEMQYQRVKRVYTLEDARLETIGTEFTACIDRTNLDRIHLLDAGGGYVGTAQLWHGPSPVDRKQIAETASTLKRQQRTLLKRAEELHAPRAQEALDRTAQSNERIAGAIAELEAANLALSPAEQAGAQILAANRRIDGERETKTKTTSKRQQADQAKLATLARQAADENQLPE